MEGSNENEGVSYVNEYVETQGFNKINQMRIMNKHKNSLDYIYFSSDTYKKYSLKQKVSEELTIFSLSEKYITEITDSIFSIKKTHKRWNLRNLIYIFAYIVIKKNHIPISHFEFMQKTKLSPNKYFKLLEYIKQICKEDDEKDLNKIASLNVNLISNSNYHSNFVKDEEIVIIKRYENESCYNDKIYELLCEFINKITIYSEMNPKIMIMKLNKENEDKIIDSVCHEYTQFNNLNKDILTFLNTKQNLFDNSQIFTEVKFRSKCLIYSEKFKDKFQNHILNESVAAAFIKYYLNLQGIKIKLDDLSKVIKISKSGISKAEKILKSFINKN